MLRMNSVRKKRTDKTVVKEHIVLAAAKAFAQKGVKTVRMDDIATGLSISKRTLYELFHDKEDLLLDVMKLHREEMLLHSEICKSYSLGEIYETVVFMHMRGISTEKGLKIVDNFLLNLKGNEHNKYG